MTTQWVGSDHARKEPLDYEILQESALAMAQATIQNAFNESGLKSRAELARRMGKKRSYVTRILRGEHNLTVKTFALALAACGFRARLSYGPMQWGWARLEPEYPVLPQNESSVPAGAGTFMLAP
jgi:transcriptional regulator with XRE-family HTH domain